MTNDKTKRKKNIIRLVLLAVLGAFLGYQVYLLNASTLVGNAMPMPFGVGASVVLSGSMEPELSKNDLIVVKAQDEYFVDDIVVFQSKGDLVVHRIIRFEGDTAVTMGDANNVEDEPINIDSIKGKVVFSLPAAGAVVSFFKTPVGIVAVIGLSVLLMELSFRREKQKDMGDIEAIKEEIRKLKEGQ